MLAILVHPGFAVSRVGRRVDGRPWCRRTQVSKKRKFVADGVFNAELNEFLARTLGEATPEDEKLVWD